MVQKRLRLFGNFILIINARTLNMSQGSVFVEFADFKSVNDFLNADPKPSWKGEDLLIMTKWIKLKNVGLKSR